MAESSHAISRLRQARRIGEWRDLEREDLEGRQEVAAGRGGQMARREGPSLRDLLAQRE
jgi:hypothetical protein